MRDLELMRDQLSGQREGGGICGKGQIAKGCIGNCWQRERERREDLHWKLRVGEHLGERGGDN